MHSWAIFVEGLKHWRANWLKLAGIYLLIYIPLTIFNAFLLLKGAKPTLIQFLSSVINWVLGAFVMASLIVSVKERLNAAVSKVLDTMKTAVKYLWRYILATLLYGAINLGIVLIMVIIMIFLYTLFVKVQTITIALGITVIAIVACVAALVYCAIRFSLAGVVCIMENAGPLASIKASHALIKKRVPKVIGVYCLVMLFYIVCFIPVFWFGPMSASKDVAVILLTVYQVLISAILVPVGACAMVILYKRLQEAVN